MLQIQINLPAVLAAAAIHMVIGALWYSPVLFAKQWMSLVSKSADDLKNGATVAYLISAVAALIMAYVLAHFVGYAQATSFGQGMVTGFWVWAGFIVTTSLVNTVFAGRRLKLMAIDAGYPLVSLLLMGGILAAWK